MAHPTAFPLNSLQMPFHSGWRSRFVAATFAVVGALACSDRTPTGTTRAPGFNVVSSPPRTDTVVAMPSKPLVLELRDDAGNARPNVSVTLRASLRDLRPLLRLVVDNAARDEITLTTDSRGRVSVALLFGSRAGEAAVIASAPGLAMEDTIAFTLLPGRVDGVMLVPRDTAIVLNATMTQAVFVRDRYGNARPERPTVAVDPLLTRAPDGTITGVAYGQGFVRASYGAFRDSARIGVVPPGRLAGMHGSSVFHAFVMNTDGSAANPWVIQLGWPNGAVRWFPDGRLLVPMGSNWPGPFRLMDVSLGGEQRLVWTPPAGTSQGWPELSRDGVWIYFKHVIGQDQYGEGIGGIWRVRRDGTGPEEVVPRPASGRGLHPPSLSPSGDRLAYIGGTGTVYVRRLADGATTTIAGVTATSVAWSPVAERLLILGSTDLHVMNPDGSAQRLLRAGGYAASGATWSPDGQWIIWNGPTGMELVRVDGPALFVTLPFFDGGPMTGGWGFAWAPGS